MHFLDHRVVAAIVQIVAEARYRGGILGVRLEQIAMAVAVAHRELVGGADVMIQAAVKLPFGIVLYGLAQEVARHAGKVGEWEELQEVAGQRRKAVGWNRVVREGRLREWIDDGDAQRRRSPDRSACVGTVPRRVTPWRDCNPSKSAKKNVRSLMMGPPKPAPNWLRLSWGLSLPSKKLRASLARLRGKYSRTGLTTRLVPLRVMTLTWARRYRIRRYSCL